MKINVLINGRLKEPPPLSGLKELAEQVLTAQGIDPNAELSLVITDKETIRNLNRQQFGHNVAADVLAYPVLPGSKKTSPTTPYSLDDPWSLGQVVVSYPAAVAQAKTCCHSVDKELAHLITRGTLKLLGYKNDQECAAKEQSILGCINVE